MHYSPFVLMIVLSLILPLPLHAAEVEAIHGDCVYSTLSGLKPIAIGHRGASGYRPEHTLASYQMAMDLGADFIEPDLVSTKDGQLIARHEPNIIDTTNVKDHPEFAARRKTKNVDGESMNGFFTEDFTLAEIKSLRAVQSHPYRDHSYDGLFEIPTLAEIIQLVQAFEKKSGRKVGLYPETKHPSYFRQQGLPLEEKLIDVLIQLKFTDPERVYIQSFEVKNLRDTLTKLMKDKGLRIPLMQLFDDFKRKPYDFELAGSKQTFGDLAQRDALKATVALYARGIGVWKDSFILKEKIPTKVDIDGNGSADAGQRLTGIILPLVADAHAAGLQVHPYTLRNEERFGTVGFRSVVDEMHQLMSLGVDGIFSDYPDSARFAADTYCASPYSKPTKNQEK